MAYAEIDDLTDRFPRPLTVLETAQAETLLEDASFWLGIWVPGLTDVVADEPFATAAKLLVVAMVRRAMLTPGTEGAESESAGPYSVKYRNPEGNLFLYGRELENLASLLWGNRTGAVSMRSPGL